MDSERELEVIRDEMEQTRANLADKLGALEEQVRETVSTASETVTSTVEGVKEVVTGVSETVGSVTETLNISKHIEEHPWIAVGIALAAGCALAQLFGGPSRPEPYHPSPQQPPSPTPPPQPETSSEPKQAQRAAAPQQEHDESGLMGQMSSLLPSLESFLPDVKEIGNTVVTGLGGLAVGSVMNVVRELAVNNLPPDWKGEVNKLVDQVTRQLGGKPQPPREEEDQKGDGQDFQKLADLQGGQKMQDRPEDQSQAGQRNRGQRQPAYQG